MSEESLFGKTVRQHQMGFIKEALAGYRQLLLINSLDVVAMNNMSSLVDPAEGEALLRKAIELKPDYTAALCNLGELLERTDREYEAAQCYYKVLKYKQDDVVALSNLKKLALNKEDFHLSENRTLVKYFKRWRDGVKNANYFFPTFHSIGEGFWPRFLNFNAVLPEKGKFASDNLICWERSLSFLEDQKFVSSVESNFDKVNCLWRVAVVAWGARHGLGLEGDLVECGTYKGGTAKILCDYLDIDDTGKQLWLYDVFDWSEKDKHFYISGLSKELHAWVKQRFEEVKNVRIIKGYVPESFQLGVPEKIAFLHIDMNNADAELGAMEHLWDRVTPGAFVVFDDYGWAGLRPQKDSADAFMAKRGYTILELPTGQGVVIKR